MKLVVMIATLMASAGAMAAPPSDLDRVALGRLAADNDAAWTRKDWAGMMAQYAAGGTLRVAPSAPIEHGREGIQRFFEGAFARRPDGFRHVTEVRNIEMVTPDMAFTDAHVRVEKADGAGWALVREFSNNSLVVREKGVWKLHSVRAYPLLAVPAQ